MKICPVCNKQFKPNRGWQRYCSPDCVYTKDAKRWTEWGKKWYGKNKEYKRYLTVEWLKKHPNFWREQYQRRKSDYKTFREKQNQWSKDSRERAKKKVFKHYGKKCNCCGELQIEFLTIDHINNDGNKHRKQIRGKYANIYSYLIKNNFPKTFQVLCWNCNLAKAKYGRCPHANTI